MKKLFILIFTFFIFTGLVSAQIHILNPLEQKDANTSLRNLKIGMELGDFINFSASNSAFLASSWLAPEGEEPSSDFMHLGSDIDDESYEAAAEQSSVYSSWSEMYGPRKAFDGNPETAWCEGASGYGIGETLMVPVDATEDVRIWAGFGKSQKLWAANSRPRKVKVWVLQAEFMSVNENDYNWHNIKVLASHEIELKDINDWQLLPLPKFTLFEQKQVESYQNSPGVGTLVAVQILSVYKGSSYTDTLISEIGNE